MRADDVSGVPPAYLVPYEWGVQFMLDRFGIILEDEWVNLSEGNETEEKETSYNEWSVQQLQEEATIALLMAAQMTPIWMRRWMSR